MRTLSNNESQDIINIDGSDASQSWPGKFVESYVWELASLDIGTACGGPDTFTILNNNNHQERRVRGYLVDPDDEGRSYLIGMIAIEGDSEQIGLQIESDIEVAGNYLRYECEADPTTSLNGFVVFEDE